MPKAKYLTNEDETSRAVLVYCPGCKQGHSYNLTPDVGLPVWTFNGDMLKPTLKASMLVNKNDPASRCHSLVKDGKIQFLVDCFHELRGRIVELPDVSEW